MPSPADAETIQGSLKDLVTLLIRDLHKLWLLIQGRDLNAVQTRDMLISASPDLVNPYASAASKLTATWYDQLAPGSTFHAVVAPLPPRPELAASARWAVGPLFGPATVRTTDDPMTRLAGSMQRRVFDASRDTVALNADAEQHTRWARYASATACAFCRMLATRDAVYVSAESATRVSRRSGSQSDRYHDHCRCIAVPVRSGDSYEPPDYVNKWQQEYVDARRAAGSGSPAAILREMRKNDIN